MAKIEFSIEINDEGIGINSSMELKGQDLYYFEQRDEQGKRNWIRDYLKRTIKIDDIEIIE